MKKKKQIKILKKALKKYADVNNWGNDFDISNEDSCHCDIIDLHKQDFWKKNNSGIKIAKKALIKVKKQSIKVKRIYYENT